MVLDTRSSLIDCKVNYDKYDVGQFSKKYPSCQESFGMCERCMKNRHIKLGVLNLRSLLDNTKNTK